MQGKKMGAGIVQVSLIIVALLIASAIASPYLFDGIFGNSKEICLSHQRMIYHKITECIHKYPESGQLFRDMDASEICDYLQEKGIIKSCEIFCCPKSDSEAETPDDYRIIFTSSGVFIDAECAVEPSHNTR